MLAWPGYETIQSFRPVLFYRSPFSTRYYFLWLLVCCFEILAIDPSDIPAIDPSDILATNPSHIPAIDSCHIPAVVPSAFANRPPPISENCLLWFPTVGSSVSRQSAPRDCQLSNAFVPSGRRRRRHVHTHGRTCQDPDYPWCIDTVPNPNHDITSFDNILWAWLTIFQCITMTNWTDIMYQLQDSVSQWAWIYFILLVVLTAYFGMNLAVAVLFTQFAEVRLLQAPVGSFRLPSGSCRLLQAPVGSCWRL